MCGAGFSPAPPASRACARRFRPEAFLHVQANDLARRAERTSHSPNWPVRRYFHWGPRSLNGLDQAATPRVDSLRVSGRRGRGRRGLTEPARTRTPTFATRRKAALPCDERMSILAVAAAIRATRRLAASVRHCHPRLQYFRLGVRLIPRNSSATPAEPCGGKPE